MRDNTTVHKQAIKLLQLRVVALTNSTIIKFNETARRPMQVRVRVSLDSGGGCHPPTFRSGLRVLFQCVKIELEDRSANVKTNGTNQSPRDNFSVKLKPLRRY